MAALFPLSLLLIGCAAPHDGERQANLAAARDLALRTENAFSLDSGLYAGELRDGRPAPGAAHCWPAAVQLSAMVGAAQVEPGWRPRLNGYIAALDRHWLVQDRIGGYDASADPPKPDRYYDDNAWMALALLEAHWLTRDPGHLRRSEGAIRFVLSGEDSERGGIWWHEQSRQTRNTCSVAPAIVALLRLHQTTDNPDYRAAAERLTRWLDATLRDADGLYFDHVRLDGTVERTKFSYNTAMMIIARCEWFDVTRDPAHLDDARRTATAGLAYWGVPATGAFRDDAAFAALFAEALLQLYRRDGDRRWLDAARDAIRFVREQNADAAGWHPVKWDERVGRGRTLAQVRLIDQAAAARAMWMAEIVR